MDLDVPESFDGPLPASGPFDTSAGGGWDSDDDDEGVLPTTSTTHTRQGLTVEPSFTETTPTHTRPMATQPSSAYAHTRATTVPPTPSFAFTSPLSRTRSLSGSSTSTSTSTSLATPTTHATTPRTNTAATPATEDVVQDATLPTKPDPPTPRTQARMERWGVWGSPWPGRGPLEEGEGSFRMDGRSLRRLAGNASSALAFAPADSDATGGAHQEEEEMQAGAQEEEPQEEDEDEDESADEGVSFLRALREDDARRRAAREGSGAVSPQRAERGGEEEDEEEEEDDREQEEEEAEVRAMSVDPDPESEGEEAEEKEDEAGDGDEDEDEEMPAPAPTPAHAQPHPEPRFVVRTPVPVRPTPPSAFDFTSTNEQAQITPLRIQAAHAHAHAQTPPTRRAPTVPAASSSSFRADSLGQQAQARAQDAEAGAESGRDGQGEGSEARKEQDERRTTPPVLIAVGTRVEVPRTPTRGGAPPQSLGMGRGRRASFIQADPDVDADAEMDDTSTEGVVGGDGDVEGEAGVEGDGDDGGSDEEDAALLGLVKITSADPRAAARAAAILKQHDYDCFTRLRHNGKDKGRRRHSFAGVSKASMPSPLAQKSKTPGLVRTGGMQDIAELRAAYSKGKEREVQEMEVHQKRRESTPAPARVVGERVYFPGSPKPVTTAQLLEEAEREVVASGVTSASPRRVGAGESASVKGESILTHAHRRTSARGVPLPESDDEDDGAEKEEGREWTKADWKALDACFTDERIAVAARLGMVLNLSPAPQPGAPSTPVRTTLASAGSSSNNTSTPAVMMASADAVDLSAVVGRFVKLKGGERVVKQWGEKWDVENLTQRARALQNKQRAGHVAPPTPSATTDVFAGDRRRASMVVPDFTPLGKRAMPPRVSSASRPMSPLVNGINRAMPLSTRAQLPQPVSAGAPFSNLPPTPEPARRRRVPGSLFAPRYSHLLEEAVAVSGGPAPRASEGEMETEESEDVSFAEDQDTGLSEEHSQEQEQEQQQDSSFESSVDDEDAEMVPATPLREREDSQYPATTQPAEPATIGKRVKGFLFSYLPTMAKTAPPPTRRPPTHAGPRLPLPPLELLEKPRGPVTTPARPPLPKTRAPKELVSLQPAPPPKPKSMLPRRAPPKRLVELHHVEPPVEEQPRVPFTRPRTSSGGSVKDLVKNFEALKGANATAKGAEVKRVRSVGDFGGKKPGSAAGAGRPMWRP
ncbi:hypothetical protein MVEN_01365200 [Mycena venus]|uniref:Uncharacterized protein n=1 Tax=Mycena venus TaxID=2733690 RepID=A0A8H6XXD9_9AGAR|nr:hypothetical protein MVEN_01365200 [Mycena venus]